MLYIVYTWLWIYTLTYLSNTNATRTSTSQVMRSNLFSPPNTRLSPRHWNLKTLIVPCNGGLPPNSSKLINFYSPLTLSWRRPLSYRNHSTGFYMITASVMKGLNHQKIVGLSQFVSRSNFGKKFRSTIFHVFKTYI